MKNHMTAKTSEQQIGLPFFQRVVGKQSGEIRNASMKDCVSGLDTTTSKVSTSRRPVRVGINASEKKSRDTTAFSHAVQGQHARP